jgi:hypothetical protein
MLKFFPVSFAKQSEGVNNFVSGILKQQGFWFYALIFSISKIFTSFSITLYLLETSIPINKEFFG